MSVGSSPLSYLTHKRKDLLPLGQAPLTGAKETARKHSGLELAADWLSSSSCLLYLLTALDSWVLLTYFTLWDIHTALAVTQPSASLSSTQAPAVLLHLHTALVWIMPLLRTSVPSYARLWPEPPFQAGPLPLLQKYSQPSQAPSSRWSVKRKSESKADGRRSGSCSGHWDQHHRGDSSSVLSRREVPTTGRLSLHNRTSSQDSASFLHLLEKIH